MVQHPDELDCQLERDEFYKGDEAHCEDCLEYEHRPDRDERW